MLVVIAQKEELKLVEELGYSNYPVLITGVGGINVMKSLTMAHIPKETEIMNIGYCGSKHFDIGTKLSITYVGTYHEKAKFNEPLIECDIDLNFDEDAETICYTSTDFVTKTKQKEPCVFDMELAFICALGFRSVKSIKVVSDNLDKKQYDKTTK